MRARELGRVADCLQALYLPRRARGPEDIQPIIQGLALLARLVLLLLVLKFEVFFGQISLTGLVASAIAGDLDADGIFSEFTQRGTVSGGRVVLDREITVKDE